MFVQVSQSSFVIFWLVCLNDQQAEPRLYKDFDGGSTSNANKAINNRDRQSTMNPINHQMQGFQDYTVSAQKKNNVQKKMGTCVNIFS